MIKNILFKQKSILFLIKNHRITKFSSFAFSKKHTLNLNNFPKENTITIVERVISLEQYLKTKIKEGNKTLMDTSSSQMIYEIDCEEYEEGYENPIFISKLISVYSYLKIIPNKKLLNKVLKYIENQNPFKFYSNFKQEEMLRFLENLVLIKTAITKKNHSYYRISNILSLFLKSFRGTILRNNKFRLFSNLFNFNKSESNFLNLCLLITKELTKMIKVLDLKECLSILWVSSNQHLYETQELVLIKEKIFSCDLLEQLKTEEKLSLLLSYLLDYSINYIEHFDLTTFSSDLKESLEKIFDYFFENKKLSTIDLINFHHYFFLTKNKKKMIITSFELSEASNLIRLSNYNLIFNTFQEISNYNISENEDLIDLMHFLVNKVNSETMRQESFTIRIKILISIIQNSNFVQKKINKTTLFNLLSYHDLFYDIFPNFRVTMQILPVLSALKTLDQNMIDKFFDQFYEQSEILIKGNYYFFMNSLHSILKLNLNKPLLNKLIKKNMIILSNETLKDKFLCLEEKLIYNSVLKRINETLDQNFLLHEIGEEEVRIHEIFVLDEILCSLIKKVRFALYMNKGYIVDKVFYLDYYIPTLKLGFLIISESNIFENKREHLKDNYSIYSEILKTSFDIDLVIIDENLLLNHADKLIILLTKSLIK